MLRVEDMTDQQKVDELHHWRGDAACRLQNAMEAARRAEEAGAEDEVARVTVADILPTHAALRDALTGDVLWPCCEGCSAPLAAGDAVFGYEGGELAHCDCERPNLADPLSAEATRYVPDDEFSPAGVERIFQAAADWIDGR